MPKQATIGDTLDHGGVITSASPNVKCGGKPVSRVGDTATCAKHGPVTIVSGSSKVKANGRARARHGDKTSCGASIIATQIKVDIGG